MDALHPVPRTSDPSFNRPTPAARPRRAARIVRCLLAVVCLPSVLAAAAAAPPSREEGRSPAQPPGLTPIEAVGPLPISSLDACARAIEAERKGHRHEALSCWESAAVLDPGAVSPRLALARLLVFSNPPRSAEAIQDAAALLLRDYRASRWLAGNSIQAIALAGTLAALALFVGLLLRHLRTLHHLLSETLGWSLRAGRASGILGAGVLVLPAVAGFGLLGTLAFWVFAISFRFQRPERLAALVTAAWLILLGPAMEACRPLWAVDPSGREAALVYEAQRDPSSAPNRVAVASWLRDAPEAPAPRFLAGLDALRRGKLDAAEEDFRSAGTPTALPPAVLENNLGTVRALRGDTRRALEHYQRAAVLDPNLFEVPYNQGLVFAATGRFVDADSAMDRAAAIDLDRLRALGRGAAGSGPRSPTAAQLSTEDLWSYALRDDPHRGAAAAPLLMLLPLRSLFWSSPLFLLVVVLGGFTATRLRRLLAVHVCFQCGRAICRRCLVRVDRHAYCGRCGETLVAAGYGESTRLLIQRLLEDRPSIASRVWPILSRLLPGIGAAARGYPLPGAFGAVFLGLGAALLAWPLWAQPALPIPEDPAVSGFAVVLGVLSCLCAIGCNALGVQAAQRRERGLRAFFERDVDRRAA